MEILVDTNVLLDFVQERAEADTAAEIITICAKDDNITGYVSAHSLMDMCYLFLFFSLNLLFYPIILIHRKCHMCPFCRLFSVVAQ